MMGLVWVEEEEEETEKWVTHYSSFHQILLVGDGDFSFSLCLANSFRSAHNITATSLDSYDTLTKKYKNAKSNLNALRNLGATIIHEVDATRMRRHPDLNMRRFDRIIYNFPHAGFHGKEDSLVLIGKHRDLVSGFFHHASGLLRQNGEIHVSHKTSAPYCNWNINELAARNLLTLFESVPFKIEDYPGYNNKRGDSSRSDEPFHLGECSTFKFVHYGCKKTISHKHDLVNFDSGYNLVSVDANHLGPPARDRFREECCLIFDWYFDHVYYTFGRLDTRIDYHIHEALDHAYDRFVDIASGRPSSDFIFFLEEMHGLSVSRIKWLEGLLANTRMH